MVRYKMLTPKRGMKCKIGAYRNGILVIIYDATYEWRPHTWKLKPEQFLNGSRDTAVEREISARIVEELRDE